MELEQALCKPLLGFTFSANYLSDNVARECEQGAVQCPAGRVVTALGSHFLTFTQKRLEKRVFSIRVVPSLFLLFFVLCFSFYFTWKSKIPPWYYSNNTILCRICSVTWGKNLIKPKCSYYSKCPLKL